jgi:predicted enzyme related to lactoylglutathione lyase
MPAFQGPDIPLIVAATIDCEDPKTLAAWWSELLGVEISSSDEHYAFLNYAPDRKTTLWFQRVPEGKTAKNRVHLDFAVPDLEATQRRIADLGGTLGNRHTWGGYVWRTFLDPEGNEFDVMQAPGE